jgi:tRNA U34 2-thiouridine synthase MnmA/TrmU
MDSSIAGKLVLDQGIEVVGVKFSSPFCQCDTAGKCNAKLVADNLHIEFKNLPKGEDYLEVIKNPRFGYGKNMNPCIDCRIFMLEKTEKIMKEIDADFIITGEVLGQRPKSQHKEAIELIENEAGLEGLIVRPLSDGLLKKSLPEQEGWIDTGSWPRIQGRSRKVQYELIEGLEIQGCSSPAGGCLLTVKDFANKVRDLFDHKEDATWSDIHKLKVGRHFRVNGRKLVIGRNEAENNRLMEMFKDNALLLEAVDVPSPIGAMEPYNGDIDQDTKSTASGMVLRYSDSDKDTGEVLVEVISHGKVRESEIVNANSLPQSKIDTYRV